MPVFNQSRSYIIRILFAAVFIIIIAQLAHLQLFSNKYAKLAMDNAVFPKIVYPERGIIYDRKGRPLLNNTVMFDLVVTPVEVKNFDTTTFCNLFSIDTAVFRQRIAEAVFKNTKVRPSVFESLLSPEIQARFEENSWRFPGFALQERPIRSYPADIGAHFLGYIGEVDTKDIERSGGFYRMGDYRGKNGLEFSYEDVLMGQRGVSFMIKDNRNRVVGKYENGEFDTAAVAGRSLKTSIDAPLQALVEQLLHNKIGAAVAINPKTGGILAMASAPGFNPNELAGAEKNANYSKMVLNVAAPLLNRAIKGQYPPGSTFKPLGGLVALDEGLITPAFGYPCPGRYYGCGSGKPACTHSGGGHAASLRLAIANSCNSYFVDVYRKVVDNPKYGNVKKGYEVWEDYMHRFGLGVKLGIDLPSEDKGNIPTVARYDKVYNNAWNSCTNLTLGIGQDMMTATPLQLANALCIIANKGYYYTPHFVDSIEGETREDTLLNKYRTRHEVLTHISDTAYSAIINGMEDVVLHGTASMLRIPGINVCAKTGTAQNSRIIDGHKVELENNSMFVCFAPKENPQIAIAVAVEQGGYGANSAGPIAKLMMLQYLRDTLTGGEKGLAASVSNKNLMPYYLPRLQYIADSTRAEEWAKMSHDSTRLKKYLKGYRALLADSIAKKKAYADSVNLVKQKVLQKKEEDKKSKQKNKPDSTLALLNDDKWYTKPKEQAEEQAA